MQKGWASSPDSAVVGGVKSAAFRHVLVCLDGSEAAEAVLPLACHLSGMDRARMTLLHVLETPPDVSEVRATDALEWEIVRQEAYSYLERLLERVGTCGLEAESRIVEGPAAHCVAAAAAELEAGLLVLSTSGEGGMDALALDGAAHLGGTAQKILALARGPVLIVPAGAREAAPHVPPRSVLVPLDGSARGECALPTALRLARANHAEIIVAHVVLDPIRTELLSTEEDLALAHQLADHLAARADAYLERIRSELAAGDVRARVAVCRATDHREGLIALAATERADLIVLSAHGAVCNPRGRFGSVTSYVIAHSTAPVLVIQDLPDQARHAAITQPSRLPPRSFDAAAGRE